MCCIAPVWASPLLQLQDKALDPISEARTTPTTNTNTKASACKVLPASENTRLGMIQQMLNEGKPHAAIAHLDAADVQAPQSDLLRADALRQTGRGKEAATLYQKLLGSCLAGSAHQGLGLLATNEGNVREAILQLHAASEVIPIDPDVRNDYGYALLLADEYEGALHELLTAIELAPGHRKAAHNLLLLLYRTGQAEKANQIAEQFGIGPADIERLKAQARNPSQDMAMVEDAKVSVSSTLDATGKHDLNERELK